MSKKVLVVDDEADVRKFLTTILEKEGYTVFTAENGSKALETTREKRPDLVILDLQMPDQSGTDYYRRLSKDMEIANTPVIIVSGLAGRHLAVKKPAAVFDKPIDPDEFLASVEKAIP